jgi:hypothetical protein
MPVQAGQGTLRSLALTRLNWRALLLDLGRLIGAVKVLKRSVPLRLQSDILTID